MIQTTDPPLHRPLMDGLSNYEQDSFSCDYVKCLQTYEAILLHLGAPVDVDALERSSPSSDPSASASLSSSSVQKEAWYQAAYACSCVPDGFMSLQRPKPASEYATTSVSVSQLVCEDVVLDVMGGVHGVSDDEMAVDDCASEDSDEDSEIDDAEAEALLARSRSRWSSSCTAAACQITSDKAAPSQTPDAWPAEETVPPPPPTDPEALWFIRAPEWSWMPDPTLPVPVPSISLTPPPEDAEYPCLANTAVWTPLQSAVDSRTGQDLLTVRSTYVFNNPSPHPDCLPCSAEAFIVVVRDSLRDGWGVIEERDILELTPDEQRAYGFHGRFWQGAVGSCLCKELAGWYVPEHIPTPHRPPCDDDEDEECDIDVDGEMDDLFGDEDVDPTNLEYASDGMDWEELVTPPTIGGVLPLPTIPEDSVLEHFLQPDGFALATHLASPIISTTTIHPSDVELDSTVTSKAPRWTDLDEDELPDLTGW